MQINSAEISECNLILRRSYEILEHAFETVEYKGCNIEKSVY